MGPRFGWLAPGLVVAGLLAAGCGQQSDESKTEDHGPSSNSRQAARVKRINLSLTTAARFLVPLQSRDGAWRSDTYGPFKDGGSLTPWVLLALSVAPSSPEIEAAYRKGVKYLAAMARPNGTIAEGEFGLSYPVYTAAGAVIVLSQPGNARNLKARDAWLAYLRMRQLTEDLGWKPADKEYGGWGYSSRVPRKPKKEALTESNISATAYALEALRAAGCPQNDRVFSRALVFIQRCQNFEEQEKRRDPNFDDGGFFFIYDDPARNKAGVAGEDKHGRVRFRSYGSTTADGLRCLLACGLPLDHPRVVAARRWLEKNFSAETHPGRFAKERESIRPAVYYYYARSVAGVVQATAGPTIRTSEGRAELAELLADELVDRQRKDGSWVNPATFLREDDPVMATCLAAEALAECRKAVIGRTIRR
jgi:squalene-hopene/tetraprenyl-beta-curcumene cyclase